MGASGTGDDCVVGENNYEISPTVLAMDYNAHGAIPYGGPVLQLQSDNNPGGGGTDGLNAFGRSYPANPPNFPTAVATAVVGIGLENGTGVANGVVGYSSAADTPDHMQRDMNWEANARCGVAGRGPTGVTGKGDNIGVRADGGTGVWATGAGLGAGVLACGGDGGGEGVQAAGRGTAAGVAGLGGDQGPGMQATGGQHSTRAGIEARGGAAGGDGVYAIGSQAAAGVEAHGGVNFGVGLVAFGGQPDGHQAGEGGGAHGIQAHGSDDNGAGVWAAGGASAAGVIGLGGDHGGPGVSATGGDGGDGVSATGGDGGVGIATASNTNAQIRLVLSLPAGDPNASNIPGTPGDLLAVSEQIQGSDTVASLWFCAGGAQPWKRVNLT